MSLQDPQRPIHQVAEQYVGVRAALTDVERLAFDVIHQCDGQTVVPVDEILFLARRLRQLARASIDALPLGER